METAVPRHLADRLRADEREFAGAVRRIEGRARAADRVRVLGGVHLALGLVGVGVGLLLFLAIAPWGLLAGDPTAAAVLGSVGTVLATVFAVLSLPELVLGLALLRRRPWARPLGVVLGVLMCLQVPFGTILGALTLYVMLQPDTEALLTGRYAD